MSMNTQYCANCGTPAIPGERFCGECGHDLTMPGSVTNVPRQAMSQGIPPAVPPVSQSYPPPNQPYPPAPYAQSVTQTTSRGGGSPLPLIIGAIVVIAVLGVGAYFLLFNKGATNNTVSGNPTATPVAALAATATPGSNSRPPTATADNSGNQPTPAGNNAALGDEVQSAIDTMRGLTSFHATVSGTYVGSELAIDGDFGKDNAQFTFQYQGVSANAIYVGGKTYLSTDSGKTWAEDSSNSGQSLMAISSLFDSAFVGTGDVFTDEGNETLVNGETAHKVSTTGGSDASFNGKVTMWLTTDQSLGKKVIRRLNVNGTSSGAKGDFTLDYKDFNKSLNITAPPVGSKR